MQKNKKAFTLTELLVSVSIITVILTAILFNYGGFNDRLAVNSAAQELAVTIRQAQTYGINVREAGVGTGQFNYPYGIYFDSQAGSNRSYVLYIDLNNNNKFDAGGSEFVQTIELRNGVYINRICNVSTCPAPGIVAMSVNFLRPNPDARIYYINSSNFVDSGPHSYGRVQLISPKGTIANIIIENTGQILVQ